MPFIARYNGKKQAPNQVPEGEVATCPGCGDNLKVRGPYSDGRASHFWHYESAGGSGGTGGGPDCVTVAESTEHQKWKSLATDRLKYCFGDNARTCRMEMQVDAPHSDREYRQADAIALFDEPDEQLGQGIVVEVQHRNESKDIEATTRDYAALDLATVWADGGDFAENMMQFSEADFRERAQQSVWPGHVPPLGEWVDTPTAQTLFAGMVAKLRYQPSPTIPATIPREFFADRQREAFRETDWSTLFSPPATDEYRKEVAESGTTGPVAFDMRSLFRPLPQSLWRQYRSELLSRVETHRAAVAEGLQADPYAAVIPVTLPAGVMDGLPKKKVANTQSEFVNTLCPSCHVTNRRPYYGESKISATCRFCGSWLTVFDSDEPKSDQCKTT